MADKIMALTEEEKAKLAAEAEPCNKEDCPDCNETECLNNPN